MQFELTKEYLKEIEEAIARQDNTLLLEKVGELHPADIAEILEEIDLEEAQYIFTLIDEEKASDALVELDEDVREKFLESFSAKEIAEQVIDNIDSDDAADVIGELPDKKQEEVLAAIEDVEQASDIAELLTHAEGTAGALMGTELMQVQAGWTIVECVREMRKQGEDLDFIYTIYVVDQVEKLLGIVSLKRILFTEDNTTIEEVYQKDVIYVYTDTPSDECTQIMDKYDIVVLPVVDKEGILVGRITIDDVVDVIKEEADKDFQMASGLSEVVESTDSVLILSRARLPWLLIGLFGGILGAIVIAQNEDIIHLHPELAFFIPLIAAMGGNVGVQSSAIIVQGLANNSLGIDSLGQKMWKEFSVALLNGLVCAVVLFGVNSLFFDSWNLIITISTALLGVVIFAGLFGTMTPLILDKYGIDPALATGPFITTVNDVFGLLFYFWIGYMMYV